MELKDERLFRTKKMSKARAEKFMDMPRGKGGFKAATGGFDDTGAGHARRAGEMIGKEGSRGKDEPHGGVENYLCHSRLKGRAGASCSSVMETLCAPADQGAT